MRRHAAPALLVALTLATAACGATENSSESTTAATAAPDATSTTAAPAAVTTTVAATTTTQAGPPEDLRLGFPLTSGDINETRKKFGVQGQNSSILTEDLIVAMIDAVNAEGGIAGHRVVPVTWTPQQGAAPDVSGQAQCEAYFAGDAPAQIVFGGPNQVLNQCATEAGAINITIGFTGLTASQLEAWPGFVNGDAATLDRAAGAMAQLAVDQGAVKAGSKAGVLLPGCDDRKEVLEKVLQPALEAAGAEVTVFESTCIKVQADQEKAVSEIPAAVLRFKSAGVETVFSLDTGFIGVALVMAEMDKQGLAPTWVLSSNNEIGALVTMNPPEAQLAKVIGAGWAPILDTFESDPAKLGPADVACVDMFAGMGFPKPANLGETAGMLSVCSRFAILEALLADSPGKLERDTMLASLAEAAPVTSGSGLTKDWSAGRQPSIDYRPLAFDAAAKKFVYTGDAVKMP